MKKKTTTRQKDTRTATQSIYPQKNRDQATQPWLQLEDLDFADNLALMLHTKHQMQSKTDTLDEISKSIGFNIHAGKSKILTSERDTIERVTLS